MILPRKIYLCLPSVIYGAVTSLRNSLYDLGILKSKTFPVPVICVGNITVGGTGKTPHVIYITQLLSDMMQVSVLSRVLRRAGVSGPSGRDPCRLCR
jgi:tetraacyldisaccharide 4'-kinase